MYQAPKSRQITVGFSLTELVVVLAVAMILMAVGMPSFMRAYHTYQLSSAATQVADMLRLARYDAIRRNMQMNCVFQVSGTDPNNTNIWIATTATNVLDQSQKQTVLGPSGNLVPQGAVPNTAALITASKVSMATTNPSPTNATITFDARGALSPPTNVDVFYLASTLGPEAGFRAVILMPAGSIQIWSSDATGNWAQIR
jgi:type IV fimbrial biogenesis protein FimT